MLTCINVLVSLSGRGVTFVVVSLNEEAYSKASQKRLSLIKIKPVTLYAHYTAFHSNTVFTAFADQSLRMKHAILHIHTCVVCRIIVGVKELLDKFTAGEDVVLSDEVQVGLQTFLPLCYELTVHVPD